MANPQFYTGVSIENCWMAEHNEPNRSPKRLLDMHLQMQHYTRWEADLGLATEPGINAIRYSVPWYKANPQSGVYEWGWIRKPLEKLAKANIHPVIDLIHYGTPLWMENGVLNHAFPERITEYASAFAQEFSGLASHFTAHNEPQLSAWFGGDIAYWPPYLRGLDGWVKVGVNVARGMVLSSQALRAAQPGCVLISADTLVGTPVERARASLGTHLDAGEQEDFDYYVKTFPACLAYGKVAEDGPFARFLLGMGVRGEEITWFREHAQAPDILGHNYYPMFMEEQSGPVENCIAGGVEVLKRRLRQAYAFYGLPLYLTETSAGSTAAEKTLWMERLNEVITDLRKEGLPVVRLNWWPLYETIQWDYRDNNKTVGEFIVPGGWNKGLYRIAEQADGGRVRSIYLEGSYAANAAATTSDVDLVVIFKGTAEEEEQTKAGELAYHLAQISAIELDISITGEVSLARTGMTPTLKLSSQLISGEDIRQQYALIPIEAWGRERMHAAYWLMTRVFKRPTVVRMPRSYPDAQDAFYGYARRTLRLSDGREVPCTRDLMRVTGWAATALLAYQARQYVTNKKECAVLYRQCMQDGWAPLLEELYDACRVRWNYLIPESEIEREALHELCRQTLGFENHFLSV